MFHLYYRVDSQVTTAQAEHNNGDGSEDRESRSRAYKHTVIPVLLQLLKQNALRLTYTVVQAAVQSAMGSG